LTGPGCLRNTVCGSAPGTMKHLYTEANLRPLLGAACGILLGCVVAAAAALLTVDPDLTAPRIWRGYYTVLVEPRGDNAALAQELARRSGVQAVVSRHTAEVSFNTFGGFRTTTVSGIADGLDSEDPRLDPYLAQVDSLFHVRGRGADWEVFYVRSDRARLPMLATLSALMSGRRWTVADIPPGRSVLRMALFLVFAGVLTLRAGSWSAAAMLGAGLLPWLAAVAVGTGTTLLLCFLVVPLWAELLERFRGYLSQRAAGLVHPRGSGAVFRRVAVAHLAVAVLGIAAAVLLARTGSPLLPAALPLLSGALVVALQYALVVQSSLSRFHPVFQAVPILRRLAVKGPWLTRRRTWDLALVAVVLGSLAVGGGEGLRRSPPHYAPAPIGGIREPLSWGGLEKLAAAGSGSRFPTLAGYLSHRAFQEALSFGRPYGLPREGERVRISRYVPALEGPEILRTERVVKRFQESWVQETLAGAQPGSVERLLLDQGFAALVLPGGEVPVGEAAGGAIVMRPGAPALSYLAALAVGLFLAAFLLGRDFRLTPPALYVTTSLTLRRHQYPS